MKSRWPSASSSSRSCALTGATANSRLSPTPEIQSFIHVPFPIAIRPALDPRPPGRWPPATKRRFVEDTKAGPERLPALPLDAADRDERRDPTRDTEPVEHLHDRGEVLVGKARLLGDAGARSRTHEDAPGLHVPEQGLPARAALGLAPRHGPPGAVRGRAERLGHRGRRPDQQRRAGLHRAADDHRLADLAIRLRHVGGARTEGAGRALTVDDQLEELAVDQVALDLRGVVADVVDHREPELARVPPE